MKRTAKTPFVIGVTGGIGCGKTTVSNMFSDLGIDIVDADVVARQVVAPNMPALNAIIEYFGQSFLLANGELNRQQLRTEVFSNNQSKVWLNNLLHPVIRQSMEQQVYATKSDYCLLVAPLLIENNLLHLVNRVLVIDVPPKVQLARTLARDPSSADEIKRIIASQVPQAQRITSADDIIDNSSSDMQLLKARIKELDSDYRILVKEE